MGCTCAGGRHEKEGEVVVADRGGIAGGNTHEITPATLGRVEMHCSVQ